MAPAENQPPDAARIAANDRGEDAAEHLAGIERFLHAPPPPGLIPWHPREVLELERNGETRLPAPRSHIKRALACGILLRNVAGAVGEDSGEVQFLVDTSATTVRQITYSALALGGRCQIVAARFLLWLYDSQPDPLLRPFAAFCTFLLAAASGPENPADIDWDSVTEWVIDVERRSRQTLVRAVRSDRWLVGIHYQEDCAGRRRAWSDLVSTRTEPSVARFANVR